MLPQLCPKSGAYHVGLVTVTESFAALIIPPLPLLGENKRRSTRSRRPLVHGWSICPSVPRLSFPVSYTSALRIDPRTPQQLLLGDDRRVHH